LIRILAPYWLAQRGKTIRNSASAWPQTSRRSIAIAVTGYAGDGGVFERRQHRRRRRKANSSPAIAVGALRVYKSQIPVIEQAIETTALMPGSDKSRGYCLAMICADFLWQEPALATRI
jgi:hypothetical protein